MIVMKFGGSSVADATCMRQVAGLVRARLDQSPLVVLSAMGKTTNALFAMARAAEEGDLPGAMEILATVRGHHRAAAEALFEGRVPDDLDLAFIDHFGELELRLRGVALLRELSPRSLDAIAAFGERLSTLVFAAWFGAARVDARHVLLTDANFGEAQPQPEGIRARAVAVIQPLLGPGRAVITQGYIGTTADGLTTTLGRGGSDYSAALFGAALGASEVQIWTDVEGVLTCDPRVVPEAQPIAELSFAEAAELAAFGAKVLHPATIQPAVEADIPVTVRHTQRPEGAFTTITGRVATGRSVTALATRGGLTVLTVSSTRMLHQPGFLAKLFEVFARHRVSVDLIATAEVSVSLTVEADVPLDPLLSDLRAFATVAVVRDRALVAVVGERLKATPGLAGKLFGALGDLNVEMISMGANEINLSLVVAATDAPRALAQLHRVLMAEPMLAGSLG
ncbi:MAG TPA: lysine-sensitive aspartokinase 3 [Holophagaceae bacterium]|nr:lysine-sensitive aspartokinase 3 [Holophagaceae bacterium]